MIFKTHMELSIENYRSTTADSSGQLAMTKIENPSYEVYRDLHNTVGQPYGWDQRSRINDVSAMKNLLSTDGAELWRFSKEQTPIGYALFTCASDKTAELEDFGFFPAHCDQGYGRFFLSKILERMAELGVEKAWLTSRSTNHPKVVSFYQKMGFRITNNIPISEKVHEENGNA